jgi:Rrf2 family protein
MEIIKRNTDYALRALFSLAANYGKGVLSVRAIANKQNIPYPLACKLMQKLQKNKLLKSSAGPSGGYELAKSPGEISVLDIVEAIQGPVYFNLCLNGDFNCELSSNCPLQPKLIQLQKQTNESLKSITLEEILKSSN